MMWKKTTEGEWRVGRIRMRHYNEMWYMPFALGRWYVRVLWREIAIIH